MAIAITAGRRSGPNSTFSVTLSRCGAAFSTPIIAWKTAAQRWRFSRCARGLVRFREKEEALR